MTFDNDFCVLRWHYRERHSRVSVNAQTITRNAPRIRALITSRNDCQVWPDRNSFTGMSTEMTKNVVFFVFLSQNTHKTHEMVKVAVINDIITLHHLCFGHCVNSSVFVLDLGTFLRELRSLRKIPKTITSNFHTMTSKKMVRSYYCLNKTNTSWPSPCSRIANFNQV